MRLIYIFVILAAVFGESVYGIYAARVGRRAPTKQYGMTLPAPGYLDLNDVGAFVERLKNNDRQNDGNGYDTDEYSGLRESSQFRIPPYDRRGRRPHLRPLSGPNCISDPKSCMECTFRSNCPEDYLPPVNDNLDVSNGDDPSSQLPIPFPMSNELNSRRRSHLRSKAAPGSQPMCKEGHENCDITWPDPSSKLYSDDYYEAAASDVNGPSFSSQLSYEHLISFSGKESKKKDNPVVAIFLVCLLCFSLLLIFFNTFFICGSWRKEYKKLEEFEVNGKMVKIATENETLAERNRHPGEAGVVKSYGIRSNCYYDNAADCTWSDNFGFVGDEAILIMVCIPLRLNFISLIILCVSLCLNKVSVILPITCVIHFSLMLVYVILCGVIYGKTYSPSKKMELNPTFAALYKMDGDMVIGPHPHKIEFASNFYAACVAAGFSIV